jgi:hypothetical protein
MATGIANGSRPGRSEKPDVSAQLAQVQNRGAPVDGYV